MTLGTSTQLFLGTAATLIASSTAFVAPMAVRSVAPATSSSSLKMQSAGSAYVETLPGAPFSDGKVSTRTEDDACGWPHQSSSWALPRDVEKGLSCCDPSALERSVLQDPSCSLAR